MEKLSPASGSIIFEYHSSSGQEFNPRPERFEKFCRAANLRTNARITDCLAYYEAINCPPGEQTPLTKKEWNDSDRLLSLVFPHYPLDAVSLHPRFFTGQADILINREMFEKQTTSSESSLLLMNALIKKGLQNLLEAEEAYRKKEVWQQIKSSTLWGCYTLFFLGASVYLLDNQYRLWLDFSQVSLQSKIGISVAETFLETLSLYCGHLTLKQLVKKRLPYLQSIGDYNPIKRAHDLRQGLEFLARTSDFVDLV